MILMALVTVGVVFWQWQHNTQHDMLSEKSTFTTSHKETRESSEIKTTSARHQRLFVDVKGAVNKPGMYELSEDARVSDAIQAAKGLTKEADESQINLAQKINDQSCLHIPKKGEKVAEVVEMPAPVAEKVEDSTAETGDHHGKININQADATQFQTIDGIGEKRAKMIVQYRTEHGPFKQIEDLKKITGIGEKTFEKLKDKVSV